MFISIKIKKVFEFGAAAIDGYGRSDTASRTKKIENKGFEDMKPEFLSEIQDDGYYKQRDFVVLKLPEGWLSVKKSTIKTTFWVGEGSYRPMKEALKICIHLHQNKGCRRKNRSEKSG